MQSFLPFPVYNFKKKPVDSSICSKVTKYRGEFKKKCFIPIITTAN